MIILEWTLGDGNKRDLMLEMKKYIKNLLEDYLEQEMGSKSPRKEQISNKTKNHKRFNRRCRTIP
jgi:hypothetical protein